MIVVLHAYSRGNAGDGLLVDLTMDLLEEAGGRRDGVTVIALHPDSFSDLPKVRGFPGRIAGLLREAQLVVGVGGGYLRAGTPLEAAKAAVAHVPQLLAASRCRAPTVYLPQSIGPLRGPVGHVIRRGLRDISRVFVRDDESLRELGIRPGVQRTPDLAVLKIATDGRVGRPENGGTALLVARALSDAPGYEDRLRRLATMLDGAAWAVQSDTSGNDDRAFYTRLLLETVGALGARLRTEVPGVVVSVRLHGALSAILHGWPTIHLAYERKGWGAFQDLGLGDFVFPARTFNPLEVADVASGLRADASGYWAAVENARPRLCEAAEALHTELAALLAGSELNPW